MSSVFQRQFNQIITYVTIITNIETMNQPRLLGIARLNEKGQLVIPKEARNTSASAR